MEKVIMIKEISFKPLAIVALAAFSFTTATAYAANPIQDAIPVAKTLSGNQKDDGWYNLSNVAKTKDVDGSPVTIAGVTGGGGFPGTAPWATPNIISQVKSDTDNSAYLRKVANGAVGGIFVAGDSLYAGTFADGYNINGGKLGVYETTPVANLANVVFQVEIGGAYGYDFYQPDAAGTSVTGGASAQQVGALASTNYFPVLNFTYGNNEQGTLTANWAELVAKADNGFMSTPTGNEPVSINLYAFQWDLSGYSNISAFNVTFNVVAHSQTYAARLTQSDTFNQVVAVTAVPEPESYAMILAGLGFIGFAARRRQV
jgi:hypothetical protein